MSGLTVNAAASEARPRSYPIPRLCPMRPPEAYAELCAGRPLTEVILPSGRTAWLVTRPEHIRRVLASPHVSTNRRHPSFPFPLPQMLTTVNFSLIGLDPPEHTAQRRMVISEFTVKRVQHLRPRIQKIVDEQITVMCNRGKPADLVEALSLPVPSLVICELLGVPFRDQEFFQATARILANRSSTHEQRATADARLRAYLSDLLTAKERAAGDDLLSRIIAKNRTLRVFRHDDLTALALALLLAGHETTANAISLGTVLLLTNPDQLAAIRADPTRTPDAVEEILRYTSIIDPSAMRVALEDIEVGDMVIRKDDAIVISSAAANWDDRVFAEPQKLDIDRCGPRHLAFGFGAHSCLGQNLARLELEISFNTLFERIPDLRLATPVEELPFKHDALVYGIYELPVTW